MSTASGLCCAIPRGVTSSVDHGLPTPSQTTTIRSSSDDEIDHDQHGEAGAGPISRSRLRIDEARSRFTTSGVDARDADFSDRLGGKRRSYVTSSKRVRRGQGQHAVTADGSEALGNLTDEDDEDDPQAALARKIARLKREVAEAKALAGQQEGLPGMRAGPRAEDEELALLSKTLEETARVDDGLLTVRTYPTGAAAAEGPSLSMAGGSAPRRGENDAQEPNSAGTTYTITFAPTYQQTHALAKAADFDRRLTSLERALGMGSSGTAPELDLRGLPRALVPTLDALQRQVSTLSEASTASLDSISRRVRTLTQEAEALEKARRGAKAAQDALVSASASSAKGGGRSPDSPTGRAEGAEQDLEQTTKINALYGTIPTIESLSPLLPPLLDRLRSLRAMHADAAAAADTLARLEQKQAEMAADVRQWREGLERVEKAVGEGDGAMEENMKTVQGWVGALEEKMARLT